MRKLISLLFLTLLFFPVTMIGLTPSAYAELSLVTELETDEQEEAAIETLKSGLEQIVQNKSIYDVGFTVECPNADCDLDGLKTILNINNGGGEVSIVYTGDDGDAIASVLGESVHEIIAKEEQQTLNNKIQLLGLQNDISGIGINNPTGALAFNGDTSAIQGITTGSGSIDTTEPDNILATVWEPAFQKMTAQMTTTMMAQVEAIGMFF